MNSVSFNFTDAIVLVTGGTSGIGYAIATGFADAGAIVTITGTRSGPSDYANDGVDLTRFEYRQVDTRDTTKIDELAASFSVLDILVNNAGASFPAGDEWTMEGFAGSLDVNMMGAIRLTLGSHAALAASTMSGGASVVNIVSMSAFRGVPSVPGYSASKAALVAMTRNIALKWMGDGIRINCVAPGLIATRMTSALELPELEAIKAREIARVPQGRMGTAEETAAAALFLSTDVSSYTNGTYFAVDGGYLAF